MRTVERRKVDEISRRYPILEKVPEEQRVEIFNRSFNSPIVWLVLVVLLAIYLYFFGAELINMSGSFSRNDIGGNGRGRFVMMFLSMAKESFVPVIIPVTIILVIISQLRAYLLKKNVEKFIND